MYDESEVCGSDSQTGLTVKTADFRVDLQEGVTMDTQAPGHGWKELPVEDKHFFYEMGVSTIAAAALVLLIM